MLLLVCYIYGVVDVIIGSSHCQYKCQFIALFLLVHHIVGVCHIPKYPHEPFPLAFKLLFICIVGCYSCCMFITCVLVKYYPYFHHLASGELVVHHIVIHLSIPSTHHHHLPPMLLVLLLVHSIANQCWFIVLHVPW